jgi:hypothetical protein
VDADAKADFWQRRPTPSLPRLVDGAGFRGNHSGWAPWEMYMADQIVLLSALVNCFFRQKIASHSATEDHTVCDTRELMEETKKHLPKLHPHSPE